MGVRRKLIQTVVNDLLVQYQVMGPHVEVERIAQGLGARVALASSGDPDVSGFLLRQPAQGVVIAVNASHSPTRRRFTIAHEIGHLLLHRGQEFHIDRGGFSVLRRDLHSAAGTNPAEVEANIFAAELLMPSQFLIPDIEKQTSTDLADERVLRELAKRYRVSPQAMAIRLANLGLIQL